MADKKVSPQGYIYGEDPQADNPFWGEDGKGASTNITATASVSSSTTGTPSVDVTKTESVNATNFDFAFKNLKGDKGDTGEQGPQGIPGETGATGAEGPAGPQGPQGPAGADGAPGKDGATGATGPQGPEGPQGPAGKDGAPGADGSPGKDGISPTVISTGSAESGAEAGTITGADGTIITIYNGAKGEAGPQGPQGPAGADGAPGKDGATGATGPQGPEGPQGPAGSDADIDMCVTDVTMISSGKTHTLKQTKGDGTSETIGEIDIPDTDNLLAEVTDSVGEHTTKGYDYHTFKETENNGIQNNIGSFYIARKQITALNSDGSFTTVDQKGNEGTGKLNTSSATDYKMFNSYTAINIPQNFIAGDCYILYFQVSFETHNGTEETILALPILGGITTKQVSSYTFGQPYAGESGIYIVDLIYVSNNTYNTRAKLTYLTNKGMVSADSPITFSYCGYIRLGTLS